MVNHKFCLAALVFYEWSSWSDSPCSVTCGDGVRTRTRTCESRCADVSPTDLTETKVCNEAECPGKFLIFGTFIYHK